MPSVLAYLPGIPGLLRLLGIVAVALLLNRLLKSSTNKIVKPAASQGRTAQTREQQTRSVADTLYTAGRTLIWVLALLTAVQEFGINGAMTFLFLITSALPLLAVIAPAAAGARGHSSDRQDVVAVPDAPVPVGQS